MASSDGVKVCIRIRPFIKRESGSETFWDNDTHQVKLKSNKSKTFAFDRVFGDDESTGDVYEEIAEPIVQQAMMGFNGTVFAYGQTSSGKTYTMFGETDNLGIIPRAVNDIFNIIEKTPKREFLLRVSYLEIYNENLKDLLATEFVQLQIREDEFKNVKVSGLCEHTVMSPSDVMSLMQKGDKLRRMASTNMNSRSSRSHTIFRLIIESRERLDLNQTRESSDSAVMVAQLNMVDLAGSERAGQTGAEGVRLKEGCYINKSLTVLGQVINQICKDSELGSQGTTFKSFRDSKLTRILQSSLGGNSLTAIICTATVASLDQTESTLRFASSAKQVKNKPKVNEVLSDEALLYRQKREIDQLKKKIEEMQRKADLNDIKRENIDQKSLLDERSRLIQEQDEKLNKLKRMLLVSSASTDNASRKQSKLRRETWCPGAMAPTPAQFQWKMPSNPAEFTMIDNSTFIEELDRDERSRLIETPSCSKLGINTSYTEVRNKVSFETGHMNRTTRDDISSSVEISHSEEKREMQYEIQNLKSQIKDQDKLLDEVIETQRITEEQAGIEKKKAEELIYSLSNQIVELEKRELERNNGDPHIRKLEGKNMQLEEQLRQTCRENRMLLEQCDDSSEQTRSLSSTVDKLMEETTAKESELEDYKSQVFSLQSQLESSLQSTKSPDYSSTLEHEMSALKSELEEKTMLCDELARSMEGLKNELDEKSRFCIELETSVEEMKSYLDSLKEEHQLEMEQLKSSKDQENLNDTSLFFAIDKTSLKDDMAFECEMLTCKVNDQQEKLTEMQQAMGKNKEEIANLLHESEHLRKHVLELKEQVEFDKAEKEILIEEEANLRSEINKLKEQLNSETGSPNNDECYKNEILKLQDQLHVVQSSQTQKMDGEETKSLDFERKIVELERESRDAQELFQDVNQKLSQAHSRIEELENLTKAEKLTIKRLTSDLESYEVMSEISGQKNMKSSELERSILQQTEETSDDEEISKNELLDKISSLESQLQEKNEHDQNLGQENKSSDFERKIVELERESRDAQELFQDVNQKLSQAHSRIEELENLTKAEKLTIKRLTSDLESYEVMSEISGQKNMKSTELERSILQQTEETPDDQEDFKNELVDKITALETQLEESNENVKSLDSQLSDCRATIKNLQSDLESSSTEINNVELSRNQALTESRNLKEESEKIIQDLENNLQVAEQELDSFKRQTDADQTQNSGEHQLALQTLSDQLQQKSEEVLTLSTQLEEERLRFANLREETTQELTAVQSSHSESSAVLSKSDFAGTLTDELAEARKENCELLAENRRLIEAGLFSEKVLLAENNKDLKQQRQLDQADQLQKDVVQTFALERNQANIEISALHSKLEETSVSLSKLQAEKDIVSHQLAKENADLKDKVVNLERSLNCNNQSSFFNSRSSVDSHKLEAKIKQLSQSVDLSQQRLLKSESVNKELKDEIKQLHGQLSQTYQHSRSVDEINKNLQSKNLTITELQKEVERQRTILKDAGASSERQMQALAKKIDEKQSEMEELASKKYCEDVIHDHEEKRKLLEEVNSELKAKQDSQQFSIEQKLAFIENLQSKISGLKDELDSSKADLTNAENVIGEKIYQIEAIQKELSELNVSLAPVLSEKESLVKENEGIREEVAALKLEVCAFEAKQSDSENVVADRQKLESVEKMLMEKEDVILELNTAKQQLINRSVENDQRLSETVEKLESQEKLMLEKENTIEELITARDVQVESIAKKEWQFSEVVAELAELKQSLLEKGNVAHQEVAGGEDTHLAEKVKILEKESAGKDDVIRGLATSQSAAEMQVKTLEEEVERLRGLVDEKDAEFDCKHNELEESVLKMQQLEQRLEALKSDDASTVVEEVERGDESSPSEEHFKQLQEEFEEYKSSVSERIKAFESEKSEKEMLIAELRASIQHLQEELSALRAESKLKDEEYNEAVNSLEVANAKSARLEKDFREAREEMMKTKKEQMEMLEGKDHLSDVEKQFIEVYLQLESLKNLHAALTEEADELRLLVEEKNRLLERSGDDDNKLREAESKCSALENEIEALQRERSSLPGRIASWEIDLAQRENSVDAGFTPSLSQKSVHFDLESEIENIRESRDRLQQALTDLEAEHLNLQLSHKTLKDKWELVAEKTAFEEKCGAVRVQCQEFEKDVSDLTKENEDIAEQLLLKSSLIETEKSDFKEKYESLILQCQEFKQRISILTKEKEDIARNLLLKNEECKSIEIEKTDVEEKYESLTLQCQEFEDKITNLAKEKENIAQNLMLKNEKCESIEIEKMDLEEKYGSLTLQSQEFKQRISILTKENEDIAENLLLKNGSIEIEKTDIEEKYESLILQCQEFEDKIINSAKEKEDIAQKLILKDEEFKSNEIEKTNIEEKYESLTLQCKEFEQRIAILTKENNDIAENLLLKNGSIEKTDIEEKYESLILQCQQFEDKITNLAKENKDIAQKLILKNEEYQSIEIEKTDMEEKYESLILQCQEFEERITIINKEKEDIGEQLLLKNEECSNEMEKTKYQVEQVCLLNNDLKQLREQDGEKEELLNEKLLQLEKFEYELMEKNSAIENFTKELATAQDKEKALSSRITSLESDCGRKSSAKLAEYSDELKLKLESVSVPESSHEKFENEIENLREECDVAQLNLRRKTEQVETLKEALSVEESRSNEIRCLSDDLSEKLNDVEKSLGEVQRDLEVQKSLTESKECEIENASRNISELKKDVEAKEKEIEDLNSELARTNKEAETLADKITNLRICMDDDRENKLTMIEAKDDLSEAEKNFIVVYYDFQQLATANEALTSEVTYLKNSIYDLENASVVEQDSSKVDDLRTELETARTESNRLRSEHEILDSKLSKETARAEGNEAAMEELKTKVVDLEKEVCRAKFSAKVPLIESERKCRKLEGEIEKLQSRIEEHRFQLDEVVTLKNSSHEEQVSQLRKKCSSLENELALKVEMIEKSKQDTASSSKVNLYERVQEWKKVNLLLCKEKGELEEKLSIAEEKISNLTQTSDGLKIENRNLKSKIKLLDGEFEEERKLLQEKYDDLTTTSADCLSKYEDYERKLAGVKAELNVKVLLCENLNGKLKASRGSEKEARSQLYSKSQEYEKLLATHSALDKENQGKVAGNLGENMQPSKLGELKEALCQTSKKLKEKARLSQLLQEKVKNVEAELRKTLSINETNQEIIVQMKVEIGNLKQKLNVGSVNVDSSSSEILAVKKKMESDLKAYHSQIKSLEVKLEAKESSILKLKEQIELQDSDNAARGSTSQPMTTRSMGGGKGGVVQLTKLDIQEKEMHQLKLKQQQTEAQLAKYKDIEVKRRAENVDLLAENNKFRRYLRKLKAQEQTQKSSKDASASASSSKDPIKPKLISPKLKRQADQRPTTSPPKHQIIRPSSQSTGGTKQGGNKFMTKNEEKPCSSTAIPVPTDSAAENEHQVVEDCKTQ